MALCVVWMTLWGDWDLTEAFRASTLSGGGKVKVEAGEEMEEMEEEEDGMRCMGFPSRIPPVSRCPEVCMVTWSWWLLGISM